MSIAENLSSAAFALAFGTVVWLLDDVAGVHGEAAAGVAAGVSIGIFGLTQWYLRSRRADGAAPANSAQPNLLELEVWGLDDELVAGWELLKRCDHDHTWERSLNATSEAETDEWEQRVLLLAPQDFGMDFRRAGPSVHAAGDPTSDLARRIEGKLEVLYSALVSRRQYLHRIHPDADIPPDRPYPYPAHV